MDISVAIAHQAGQHLTVEALILNGPKEGLEVTETSYYN